MKLHSDKALEAEVLAVVERFRTGWEKMDAEQILSTIAPTDDMVMYGTDLVERWVGYESLVEPTKAMTEAFSDAVYKWGADEPMVWVRGDVGWACGDLTVSLEVDGEPLTVVMRSTFVVTHEESGWKIAHSHFSVGQEEPVADYD